MSRMSDRGERFDHPLIERYASQAMATLFSPRTRHTTWRDLWIALAQAQHELGLPVTRVQIDELRAQRDRFDWDRVASLERELRHDVMAHVHHYGELAPSARPIIHLGATSCFVTDNAELLQMRDGLDLLLPPLLATIDELSRFAREHAALPALAFTHFQPAQPTTVGKRACLWIQDLADDARRLVRVRDELLFRGVKGTTGTQASFLELFGGDH